MKRCFRWFYLNFQCIRKCRYLAFSLGGGDNSCFQRLLIFRYEVIFLLNAERATYCKEI